ncbi:hypothetical protein PISMIDRAFT_18255 [Pisolithus microcarpus 441]|uniref:C2H2-type domain-containing protein n=1 Tax=Pisolithus microcarpus 441 TaxID=765257 RepID=A0A0C9XL90_9AGAM|nr:hypothetical protein BKA83DRAFT_18255 [Pisolithus microcarpus]KIK13055.1 hypothetical protein PISMIDRAFT_18255 [Pisolithus microcarpus 441]
MHLASNISDLLISLWCGTIDHAAADDLACWPWAVLADEEVWHAHGDAVEHAGHYLPTSYNWKPQNIADKINMHYKTWEFQLYIFALTPILLYSILPTSYWANYCKLICGFQIMCQSKLTMGELVDAHALICSWECEFKLSYYQLLEEHIHFVHPCVHQVVHLVSEAIHKGPPICTAQWTMEWTIGNLSEQIRQPSKPFMNLSHEGVRWCQVNSLLSIMPELDDSGSRLPHGSIKLGDGYALLHKCSKHAVIPCGDEATALSQFLGPARALPHIKKWAQLHLPNGQVARSAWRELLRPPEQICTSQNVKGTYMQDSLQLTVLQERCQTLKQHLVKVTVEHDTIKNLFDQLANTVKLPTCDPSLVLSGSLPLLPFSSASEKHLTCETHTKVQFWMKMDCNNWLDSPEATGSNCGLYAYLEDDNGGIPTSETLGKICKALHASWRELGQCGMAPDTWGKASTSAIHFMWSQMEKDFPLFKLAENRWKLEYICTKMYSAWRKHHLDDTRNLKRAMRDMVKEEALDDDDNLEDYKPWNKKQKGHAETTTPSNKKQKDNVAMVHQTKAATTVHGQSLTSSPSATSGTILDPAVHVEPITLELPAELDNANGEAA